MVEVRPATRERFEDIVSVLGCNEQAPCCCQYRRMSSGGYNRASTAERREALLAQTTKSPPPEMLAYLGAEPVGWCGLGVRQRMERLAACSRRMPEATTGRAG
jgi:hypothetical protein